MGNRLSKKNWRYQKFLEKKKSKVSLQENLEEYHSESLGDERDEYWDFLIDPLANINGYIAGVHCCEDCYYSHIGMATQEDVCVYNYQCLYERVTMNDKTLANLNVSEEVILPNVTALELLKQSIIPGNHIEERLTHHLMDLRCLHETMDAKVEELRKAIGNFSEIEILKKSVGPKHAEFVAKWACLLSPFWLRSPSSWKMESGISIVDHIFTLYTVPGFLLEQWFINSHNTTQFISFKWISWYIIIGQGGSLKKVAKHFNWKISNKFQYYLLKTPSTLNPMQSCLHAEIHKLGGSEIDFRRLMDNRTLVLDPTEPMNDKTYSVFWKHTVLWLITHSEAITDEESSLIIDWAVHMYTEGGRNENLRGFTWKGRTVNSVLAHSLEYVQQLTLSSRIGPQWNAKGWDWEFEDNQKNKWKFNELTNGKELFEEGYAMLHCVNMYSGRCVAGTSSIFSLKKNGERSLTLEINPKNRILVQSRGKRNRKPYIDESEIVRFWIETIKGKYLNS